MHRTLFTPSMIDTYRICKRAYELAYTRFVAGVKPVGFSGACKRFVLRALSEIHRGKLINAQQVQKYMGQGWPLDRVSDDSSEKEKCTRAFLFAFKSLTRYVEKPYRPDGSEVVAVALKVRARVAHVRVYVEDTIDLILWHPHDRRLELVNFQMAPLKPSNPAWPSVQILVKAYLAERLKQRWEFDKLSITTYRVGTQEYVPETVLVDEPLYRAHWEEMVKTLEDMKQPCAKDTPCGASNGKGLCRFCAAMKRSEVYEGLVNYTTNAISA